MDPLTAAADQVVNSELSQNVEENSWMRIQRWASSKMFTDTIIGGKIVMNIRSVGFAWSC